LAGRGLAAHQKKARRLGAWLIWLDESGLLMAPLLRRSWAPEGHPPAIKQKAGHREKVSVAAALGLAPSWDRLGLAYRTLVNGYFDGRAAAAFAGDLLEGLGGPAVLLWDGGTMHKGDPVDDLVALGEGRLHLEPMPAHAPDLMPPEQLWTWLKYSRLCNFAPANAHELNERVLRELATAENDQLLLRSFLHASHLPLPRALLS
jgi:hypothetical protein